VVIEDSGPGFDQSKIARIFDVFVTSKVGGMGLGLAISRTIVERHGGRISASSANPRGAALRVDLPVPDPYGRRDEVDAAAAPAQITGRQA
jgi:signal transduction histidine kinase